MDILSGSLPILSVAVDRVPVSGTVVSTVGLNDCAGDQSDTKQLLANYENIPQNLIQAIVSANSTRKDHIADSILEKAGFYQGSQGRGGVPGQKVVIGIYRLIMKSGLR